MRTKRLLSLVMAFFMLFTLTAPTFAWASEGDGNDGDGDPATVNPDPVANPDPDPDPVVNPDPDPDPVVNPDPDPVDDQDDDQDDLGDDPAPDPDPETPATRNNALEEGWYLVGTMTEPAWEPQAAYYFGDPDGNGVYSLSNKELTTEQGFKAVYVYQNAVQGDSWYPSGTGNEKHVTANGTYTIYFKNNDFLRATTLENGFYVVGINGWNEANLTSADKLQGSGSEYSIEKDLVAANEFKIRQVAYGVFYGDYYPDGANISGKAGNYVISYNSSTHEVAVKKNSALTLTAGSNGSVTTTSVSNPAKVTEGTHITVTITPDAGYEIATATFNGNDIVLDNGVYTFNMPDEDVTVSATFTETAPAAPAVPTATATETPVAGLDKAYIFTFDPAVTAEQLAAYGTAACNLVVSFNGVITPDTITLFGKYGDGAYKDGVEIPLDATLAAAVNTAGSLPLVAQTTNNGVNLNDLYTNVNPFTCGVVCTAGENANITMTVAFVMEGVADPLATVTYTFPEAAPVPAIETNETATALTATIENGVFTDNATQPVAINGTLGTVSFNADAVKALANAGALTLTVAKDNASTETKAIYNITLSDGTNNVFTSASGNAKATVTLKVGADWNGKTVVIKHIANNVVEATFTKTVAGGVITVDLPHFSTVTIEQAVATAYVGGVLTAYDNLAEAIEGAADGDTITLLADASGAGLFIGPNKFTSSGLTIDFGGYTYTVETPVGSPGTVNQMLHFEKGNKITLTNGSIVVTADATKRAAFDMIMQNYCTLTIAGMTIDGTGITVKTYGNNYAAPWGGSAKPQFNYNTAGNSVIRNSTITVVGDIGIDDAARLTIEDDAIINANKIVTKGTDERYDSATATVSVENGAKFTLTNAAGAAAFDALLATNGQSLGTAVSGVYTVRAASYVAQNATTGTRYESLADAVAAADSGDTITLLGNLQLDAVAMFSENKTLTLDLGGNTLSSSVDDADAGTRVLTVEAGTLTVQNGTITGRVNAYDNGTLTIAANATVNGMAVVWGDGQGASAKTPTLNVYGTISNANGQAITTNGNDKSGATINIYNGAAVTATGHIAIYQPSGNVNVSGGTITGSTAIYQKSGTLTISGGALVGNGAADTPDFANGSGADATGDALVVESCAYPNGAPTVSISAGTFTSTNGKGIASYANESKGVTELAPVHATTNTITIPADEKWVDDGNGGYTLVKKVYVAQIGDVKYETLAEAIAAVADNTATTITMIGDETIVGNAGVTIPATTIITLDLNGHTLKNAVNQDKASQVITNKGTLTIVDNSQDKSGLITNAIEEGTSAGDWWSDPQRNYATNVIFNSGTLNLQSGTIRQTAVGSICYAIDNNSTAGNAILNISGGKVVSAVGTAMRMFCNSTTNENTLNMTGGEISGAGVGFWVQLPGSNSTSKKKATVDISGGTVHGSNHAWYDYSFGDSFEVVDYSISGGVMDGDIYSNAVEGGVIDGFITGGIFSKEPNPIYVDPNKAAFETTYQSEDGWYMIGAAVAQIGTVGYISLAAAVTGASAGDTVKMLANEELDAQVVIDKSLTLDLNGKTIYNDAADDDIWGGSSWSLISVQGNGVAVTVTDTSETAGTLQAKVNDTYAMDIRDGATLTIEKGNFIGNVHAIYVCEGTLNVNGGFFKVQQVYSAAQPYDFTLNCLDANYTNDTAKITVNGGTFYMFDPQASASEPGGTADFTADDYVAIKDGDNYVVQPGWNVTFDTNGGTPTPDAQRVAAGGTVAEPAAPTMEAEIFGGWSDGMSVVTFPYTPAADVTLTAQWTAAVASITAGSPAVTTYYATLAEAIAAANADASATAAKPVVVTLLSDVNVAAPIMVSNHVTLDGGNHTITSTKNRGVRVDTNGVTVTVKNLTIQGTSLERAIQVDSGKDDVTLTIDNVTANATMYTVNVCSDVDNLNLTIKDSYLTGWGVVNLWGNNGTVTITGSTLIGINDKEYNAEGWNNFGVIVVEGDTTGATTTHAEAYAITVTNSTIEARSTTGNTQYSLLYNKPSADNAMTLEGCTVVLGNKCEFYADGGDDSTTKLKNTTVQGTDAIPELPEGYCYVEDAQGYQVVTKAVAEVWNGNTKVGSYASLADAITAATAGYTVKLLDDVALTSTQVIDKNLTIDLNGKDITATDARALWIKAGNVTITGEGTISATGTSLDASSSVIRVGDSAANANKAKLTVGSNVTVSSDKCYGITVFGVNDTDNDKTTSDIELVMNGTVAVTGENPAISGNGTNNLSATIMTIGSTAEVSAANDYAIYHPGKGTLTVNGKVEGKGGIEVKGGTVTINNGATVEATANAQSHTAYNNGVSTSGYAIAAVSNPNYAGDPTVTINGGTINGKAIILADFEAANVGVVTATSNEIAIDPDYKWVETETAGTYKLVEKVYVAQIVRNEQTLKFESLEAAVAAAVDGDTITLLSDCEGNGIVFLQGKFGTNGLTIDFGHYTYTVSGTPVGSTDTETIGFQLLKDNKITLKDGTLTGSSRTNRDLLRMIQNYSDLTLDNMTISLVGQYYDQTTMSTCNGTTVIEDSTVNAPDFTWAHITVPATVRGAAISVGTFSTYTGVSAEVTGDSVINGDIIVDPSTNAEQNTLTLTSGTLNGAILMKDNAADATVTQKDTFNATAPEDYEWVSNGDGTSTLRKIPYVAQIGNVKYLSLADAIATVGDGETIVMIDDEVNAHGLTVPAGKNFTVDFDDHTYTVNKPGAGSTGTETAAFQLLAGSTITFKNGTIQVDADNQNAAVAPAKNIKRMFQSYANVTFEDMVVDGTNLYDDNAANEFCNGNVVITGNSSFSARNGVAAINVDAWNGAYPDGAHVTINTTGNIGTIHCFTEGTGAEAASELMIEAGNIAGLTVAEGNTVTVQKDENANVAAPEGYTWSPAVNGVETLIPYVQGNLKLSVSVTLNDNININLVARALAENTTPDNYYMIITFRGVDKIYKLSNATQFTENNETKYKMTIAEVYSYEMGVELHGRVMFTTNAGVIDPEHDIQLREFDYSVKEYFTKAIKGTFLTDAEKNICRAALDYGAAAQIYFNGKVYDDGVYATHPEDLVNKEFNADNVIEGATEPTDYAITLEGTRPAGLTKMSVALILGSEVSIKIYFKYTGDINALQFSAVRADDAGIRKNVTSPKMEGDRYFIKITGIKTFETCKYFTLTITDGENTYKVTYSPYVYLQAHWNDSDAKLANLCKTLVKYSDLANRRWPNE